MAVACRGARLVLGFEPGPAFETEGRGGSPSSPVRTPTGGLSRALSSRNGHAYARLCREAMIRTQRQQQEEEGGGSDWSDDDEDGAAGSVGHQHHLCPPPRDPHHYQAMVYARAVINAKLWQLQA